MINSFSDRIKKMQTDQETRSLNEKFSADDIDDYGSYPEDVELEIKKRNEGFQKKFGTEIPKFIDYVQEIKNMQKGKGEQLEAFAEKSIRLFYGDILGDTELNLKFPRNEFVKKMIGKSVPEIPAALTVLENDGVISKIHVRKIQKNLAKSEGDALKKILGRDEFAEGLDEIFGKKDGKKFLDLAKKIADIAFAFNWILPSEVQEDMWERSKTGFCGTVSVSWNESEEKDQVEMAQYIIDELIHTDVIDGEDIEKLFDSTSPTISVVGTDLVMVLHQAIKGVYELIMAAAVPEEEEEDVEAAVTGALLANELEDLRYETEIAGDLRDLLDSFAEIKQDPTLKGKVFGKMVSMSKDDPNGFLSMMLNFLKDEETAKERIQEIITDLKDELSEDEEVNEDEIIDIGNLSKREINRHLDKAIECGDYIQVEQLSSYLSGSDQRKLYERVMKAQGLY